MELLSKGNFKIASLRSRGLQWCCFYCNISSTVNPKKENITLDISPILQREATKQQDVKDQG